MRILVTGSAGFIGFHVSRRLLELGHEVTGFDAMTAYYDPELKAARHGLLQEHRGFRPVIGRLEDAALLGSTVEAAQPEVVLHLAAQAGVRHSIEHPEEYVSANIVGTFNLLEAVRKAPLRHLLVASTSSAYGARVDTPFAENDRSDHPLTVYAATKKAGEAMTHAYAHLWGMPVTCLRFFTVYGPWGRPDMALFRFVAAMSAGEPIEVYGDGQSQRDFTYVDDLVAALVALIDRAPELGKPVAPFDSLSDVAPWRLVNIGGGQRVPLKRFIAAIEAAMGVAAVCRMQPMQPGDLVETLADTRLLEALVGSRQAVPVEAGVAAFVGWYRDWTKARHATTTLT